MPVPSVTGNPILLHSRGGATRSTDGARASETNARTARSRFRERRLAGECTVLRQAQDAEHEIAGKGDDLDGHGARRCLAAATSTALVAWRHACTVAGRSSAVSRIQRMLAVIVAAGQAGVAEGTCRSVAERHAAPGSRISDSRTNMAAT
jgi:hypothetical protein